jgi:glycosyltransferase involved in cell wall biosynthesis
MQHTRPVKSGLTLRVIEASPEGVQDQDTTSKSSRTVERLMKKVQIYEQARTVHLERILSSGNDTLLLYRTRAYDFDEALAQFVGARQMSRWQTSLYLLKERPAIVELNEPMLMAAWPGLLLYITALQLVQIFGRRARVISFAINNAGLGPAIASFTRMPLALSNLLSRIVCTFLLRQYDRMAFGTPSAIATYVEAVGHLPKRLEHRLFLALDKACSTCTPVPKQQEVVFLGSFEPRKGILQLLAAWPAVVERLPLARLRLLGKGPLLEEVKEWVTQHPTATLTIDPSRHEIHSRLNAGKVLVLLSQPTPRWKEQVGLPILEGLSHGCEIVASLETGIAEWLVNAGHHVVDPHLPTSALAETIIEALTLARDPAQVRSMLPTADTRISASDWLWAQHDL